MGISHKRSLISRENYFVESKITVGMKLNGVVLHVDVRSLCLELSFDKKLASTARNFKDNRFPKVNRVPTLTLENLEKWEGIF